ncbi:hypothetical protein [Streptosporangium roseum]|uniref:Uncharacterized protein n=1 Tax=Streptosporangium roseum (strain ATCC 12428 / DSM 43021 / JCM 3005 / KCTC 9067 / NCIMB 10171 / NRRL 2505 / NI 9100) TaxID=479432 RepID=D2B5P5_STRRD|nr:hypothetical protein [Streptosporangium roseum]ACZ91349.1 hypothetical protein Sros_8712 [Streptosporangium roseum DSM 43021]
MKIVVGGTGLIGSRVDESLYAGEREAVPHPHDFMMLNPVRDTHAARTATAQAIDVLKTALNTGKVHS